MQSFTVYNYSILYINVYYLSFRQLGIVNQYKNVDKSSRDRLAANSVDITNRLDFVGEAILNFSFGIYCN